MLRDRMTDEEREAHDAVVKARAEHYEAHRTEPDYWIRKAESALRWGAPPEKVAGYLAMARYYRDGETT